MDLKEYIRSIPDYPKKGILFRDITTLIKNEKAFTETINQIAVSTSTDIIKQIIGVDINNSSISAIVEDISKKGKSII